MRAQQFSVISAGPESPVVILLPEQFGDPVEAMAGEFEVHSDAASALTLAAARISIELSPIEDTALKRVLAAKELHILAIEEFGEVDPSTLDDVVIAAARRRDPS